MTLATTCTECGTSFRVQPEQLRQRGGLVRCGACQHVFNALESLQPVTVPQPGEDPGPDLQPAPGALPEPARSAEPLRAAAVAERAADPAPAAAPVSAAPAASAPAAPVPPGPEPIPAFAASLDAMDEPVPVRMSANARLQADRQSDRPAVEPVRSEPPRAPPAPVSQPTPAEPARAAAMPARPRRPRAAPTGAGRAALVGLLALAALVQTLLLARHALAVQVPAARPVLSALAGVFGLRVELPRRLSQLTIEGFDLSTGSAPSQLVLSAVLRNSGNAPVQWPAMELTLTDPSQVVVVRKVLQPAEYLTGTSARLDAGVAPRSEQPLRLVLQASSPVQSTGYTVNLFYP